MSDIQPLRLPYKLQSNPQHCRVGASQTFVATLWMYLHDTMTQITEIPDLTTLRLAHMCSAVLRAGSASWSQSRVKQATAWCDTHHLSSGLYWAQISQESLHHTALHTETEHSPIAPYVVYELCDTPWVIIPYRVPTSSSFLLKSSHFCSCEKPCGDGTRKIPSEMHSVDCIVGLCMTNCTLNIILAFLPFCLIPLVFHYV